MDLPLTISETHKMLFKKEVTAVSLVDSYLERINRLNPELNALLTISQDEAYEEAKKVDALVSELGTEALTSHPLLGVTVVHKDLFSTEGIRTTAGSKVLESYVPAYSATVVTRLKEAGCITLGKTNCDAWGHGSSGENSDFNPTKNPWNLGYVPGGSSSGSAAAVAANLSLAATGTDTGSSVRHPASFCGTFGLKPTYGAVPRYGVIAMASSLDTIGHMGRTTEDIEKIFGVTKGPDGHDSTVADGPWKTPSGKLKVGVAKEYFVEGIDREVEKSVLQSIEVFKDAGVEIVDISLPHTKEAIPVYYIIQPAEVSSNLGRFDGVRYGNTRDTFGDEAKRRIMLGTYVLSAGYYDAYYLKAMKVRSLIIADFDQAFEKVDAIIAPVSPTPPFKLGEKADDPLKMYLADVLTVPANLAGIPGLAVPFGQTLNGLPLGFQLMGPRFSEPVLFELGKIYEKVTGYCPKIANV